LAPQLLPLPWTTVLLYAIGVITLITLTLAPLTGIMARNGLTAASSLASAHGTAGDADTDTVVADMDTAAAATDTDAADMHLAHVADTQHVQVMLVRLADTPVEQPAVTLAEQLVARPLRLAVDLAAEPVVVVDSVAAAMQAAAVTAVVDTGKIGVSAS